MKAKIDGRLDALEVVLDPESVAEQLLLELLVQQTEERQLLSRAVTGPSELPWRVRLTVPTEEQLAGLHESPSWSLAAYKDYLGALRDRLKKVQIERDAAVGQVSEVRDQLRRSRSDCSALVSEKRELGEKLERLKVELARVLEIREREQLGGGGDRAAIKDLIAAVARLKDEKKVLEDAAVGLRNQRDELGARLNRALEEKSSLADQVKNQQEALIKVMDDRDQLRRVEIPQWNQRYNAVVARQDELYRKSNKYKDLYTRQVELRHTLSDKLEEAVLERDQMRARLTDAEEERDRLRVQLAEATARFGPPPWTGKGENASSTWSSSAAFWSVDHALYGKTVSCLDCHGDGTVSVDPVRPSMGARRRCENCGGTGRSPL